MEDTKTLLWLDDVRDPLQDNWLVFAPIEQPYQVVWVKNYNEFTNWITSNGLPAAICFDHDLAGTEEESLQERTGKDCANWLVEYCMDRNYCPLPEWNIHSANPPGAANIRSLLISYETFADTRRIYTSN